jgi:hypothetical protein
MQIETAIKRRIVDLLEQAEALTVTNEHGQARSQRQLNECSGWLAAAVNIASLACGNPEHPYAKQAQEFANSEYGWTIPAGVGGLAALLRQMDADISAGLLGSVADRARAETFDTFLDHGEAYLQEKRIREAGVIVGVVFEDSVRKICVKHKIDQDDVKLDALVNALVKARLITDTKAKRARTAAGVRNAATHAKWDEYTESDVSEALNVTRELISTHLDA